MAETIFVDTVSILTATFGQFGNVIALTYFFRHNRRGLFNKLRLSLIVSDILYLVGAQFLSICTISNDKVDDCDVRTLSVFVGTSLQVGLVTTVIATVKAIAVAKPIYVINSPHVYKGTVVLTVINIIQSIPYVFKYLLSSAVFIIAIAINCLQIVINVIVTTAATIVIMCCLRKFTVNTAVNNLQAREHRSQQSPGERTPQSTISRRENTAVNNFQAREKHNVRIVRAVIMKGVVFTVTTLLGTSFGILYNYHKEYPVLFSLQRFLLSSSSVMNAVIHIVHSQPLRNYAVRIVLPHQHHAQS